MIQIKKIVAIASLALISVKQVTAKGPGDPVKPLYLQNRYPLVSKPYISLPLGAVKPKGWLYDQLLLMKNGMAGKLDELYPAVLGKRNGWLGGDGDVWERGPYWLDGLVPLAYILGDKDLIAKTKPWIEWSLNHQMNDGYFGPIPPEKEPAPEPGLQRNRARDWWPKMVMLKVLQQYYDATGDKRVIDLMLKYAHYQLKTLPATPLGHYSWWGSQRGGDNLLIVYWLYNITGDKSLLDLAQIIHQQTFDWTNTFLHSDELHTDYAFHGVNLAQGIKEPVIYYQQNPDEKYLESVKKAFADIRKYQGQVQGMYGADELTRGNDPVQGSELCSAVELMYSLENMIAITGDVNMMDQLERIAYNALPTQTDDDYTGRQYYQQANQVMITRHNRNFVTPYDGTDICYGVLTGFPCCTTNMHQGWPKLIQNLWLATEDKGIAALVYGASEVNAKVADGRDICFSEETNYPFDDKIQFQFKSKSEVVFPLHLRIPSWCRDAIISVNGEKWMEAKGGQIVKINRKWTSGDKVTLTLPMTISTSRWFNNSVSVERGPLVYALRVEEQWKDIKGTDKYGDYKEVRPLTDWNFGLVSSALKNPDSSFEVVAGKYAGGYPWNLKNTPIEIRAKGKQIPEWGLYNETAGPLPYSNIEYLKTKKEERITLVPYGCSTLRIAEFPVVD
jgi:DUF1680 family protein